MKPLEEGIVVTWGGNVLFALCPDCHPDHSIVMEQRNDSQGQRGVYVGFLRAADRPPDILPLSDLGQLNRFVPQVALAQYEKLPFGEDE